jgi:hypothetical protein
VGEVFYQLVSGALCFQFCDVISSHLLPHQFGVNVRGGYEVVVHNICTALNVHFDVVFQVDIANAFNSIWHKAIF